MFAQSGTHPLDRRVRHEACVVIGARCNTQRIASFLEIAMYSLLLPLQPDGQARHVRSAVTLGVTLRAAVRHCYSAVLRAVKRRPFDSIR